MSRRGLPRGGIARQVFVRMMTGIVGSDSRARRGPAGEGGMTTAEYAVGTLAACAFAALLIAVVRSPEIRTALTGLIVSALGLGK